MCVAGSDKCYLHVFVRDTREVVRKPGECVNTLILKCQSTQAGLSFLVFPDVLCLFAVFYPGNFSSKGRTGEQ